MMAEKINRIPPDILDFLNKNRVATVCVLDKGNAPSCFSAFFICIPESGLLVFKSSAGTSHEIQTQTRSVVAGTVMPEHFEVIKIRGIQFKGYTLNSNEVDASLGVAYHSKYTFGRLMQGYIWAIKLEWIKFTDNTLSFGKKITWIPEPVHARVTC
jgi:uncharacterized protein YhbP (UPF0306 family)